jgi:hypothetical protein
MARDQDRTSVRDLGKKEADRASGRREQPGKTPGQAEGDRRTVEEDLRQRRKRARR